MKKLLLCLGLCLSVTTFAQKKEWLDPELNAINRAPQGRIILLILPGKWLSKSKRRIIQFSIVERDVEV